MKLILAVVIFGYLFSLGGCASAAASAEEYYSIGMAYFELGRYEEAERWLIRARQANRTMTASTYNLGRLAFERQRYEEAARHFESILRRDPDNVLALRAAAYSRIMTEDLEKAGRHYTRLLAIVPDSVDSGYNHALILFAMGRFAQAEEVLQRFPIAIRENKDNMLLFARTQAAQNKVEAIETFSLWLADNSDVKVRYEYGKALEHHEFYARALEEYRKALADISATAVDPKKSDVRFAIARVLLIADRTSNEGITELQTAINEGFNDLPAVEGLANFIATTNREAYRNIVNNLRTSLDAEAAAREAAAREAAAQDEETTEEESQEALGSETDS